MRVTLFSQPADGDDSVAEATADGVPEDNAAAVPGASSVNISEVSHAWKK